MVRASKKKKRLQRRFAFAILLTLAVIISAHYASTLPKRQSENPTETIDVETANHFIEVPCIDQNPDFPTGCESVSAVMALQYFGESIDVSTFIDHYLPCDHHFYRDKYGKLYGPNPFSVFVGDPRQINSYGCYAPVIEKALIEYFRDNNRLRNTTGTSMEQLCEVYITKNIPVLIWASMGMKETYPSGQWQLENGETFQWIAREHCLVLVGYDEKNYFFNDPLTGTVTAYEKQVAKQRYSELGQQSLVILPATVGDEEKL